MRFRYQITLWLMRRFSFKEISKLLFDHQRIHHEIHQKLTPRVDTTLKLGAFDCPHCRNLIILEGNAIEEYCYYRGRKRIIGESYRRFDA